MRPNLNDRPAGGTPSRNLGMSHDRWLNSTKFFVMNDYLSRSKYIDNWDKYNFTRKAPKPIQDFFKWIFPGARTSQ